MTPGDVARDAAIEASCPPAARGHLPVVRGSVGRGGRRAPCRGRRPEGALDRRLRHASRVGARPGRGPRRALLLPALLCRVATYATADAGDVAALVAFADDAEDRPGELRDFRPGPTSRRDPPPSAPWRPAAK
jgi:hypothetical protein